jgi:CRP-like cAMP-binding protein
MDRKEFQPQEVIFSEGDPSDLAYFIVLGSVDIFIGARRERRSVATLGPGEVFGEMGLIEGGPRSATAISVERTVCATYDSDQLLAALEKDPKEALVVIRSLISRLRDTNRKMLTHEGVERR